MSGLSQHTVYHYRVVATNQYGTAYGYDSTFTTLQPANCQAYFTSNPDSSNYQFVYFWNQSSGSNITTYIWSFGDGSSQTITYPQNPNVTHYFNSPGVYAVCLTIQSANLSCNNTYCTNITVGSNSSCHAAFTSVHDSSSVYSFLDQSTGNITSWLWNFGDPASGVNNYSTLQNAMHAFSNPGTYYVCLTVQGADTTCFDITCDTIVVANSGSCDANFSFSQNPTTSAPTQFTDLSQSSAGAITSWFWVFGDPSSGNSNVSTLQNPAHQFSTAGIYQVCLTIRNGDSTCYDYICKYVEVTSGGTTCTALFESIMDSTSYYTYHFFDLSYPAIESWSWSFGDGTTSTLQNPTHTYSFPDTYYVCLTVTSNNGTCTDTYCDTIIIISCQSYFTYVKNMRTVNFTGHMVNSFPSSYFWDFGDGNNGQGETIQHTYSSAGTYTVTLLTEDWLDCTFTSQQQVVVVDSSPNYNLYGQVFGGNFPITSGVALLFQVDSIFPYSVLADTCMIDSLGVYYFTEVPEGDYYIYAIPFYPIGYLPTYYGNSLNWNSASLVSLGQPVNPYNIQLILADSLLPGNGSIHGQINVAKSNASDLTDKIMVILMNKNYQAIATTKIDKDGSFEFTQLAYGTYLIKPELAGIHSDLISVDLSESTPDTTITLTFSGNQILGYKALAFEYGVGPIFPNPVKEDAKCIIQSDRNGVLAFEILTISGAFVHQLRSEIGPGANPITLPTSGLPSGFYFIRITDVKTGISTTKKLIKTD